MANVPISNLTTTWNNVSTTFTGIKLNVTDTASAAASLLIDLQVGGTSQFKVNKIGLIETAQLITSIGSINNTSVIIDTKDSRWLDLRGFGTVIQGFRFQTLSVNLGPASFGFGAAVNTNDVVILRDAAAVLAQRNGVNAQTFRLYNTFTDVSNYERGFMQWNSNVLEIGMDKAGTGSDRNVRLRAAGSIGDTSYFEASWNSGMSVNWSTGSNNSKVQWLNGNIQFSVGSVTNFLGINTSGSNRLTLADTVNIEVGTTTGTKIGTATSQKLSFYNATPVVQPSAVADATDAASVISQLNTLLARVRTLGLIAT